MPMFRVVFEDTVEADSPEDAAVILRDMLKGGTPSTIFVVDVAQGKVVVDTENGNETVVRDDRKTIGPVVIRREGPTGVVTSPVMARFYEHDNVDSTTDLELIEGKWLRLRGCGDDAYYELVGADSTASEPFAVITVRRKFAMNESYPASHLATATYDNNAQH